MEALQASHDSWIDEYKDFQEEGFERIKFYYGVDEADIEEDDRLTQAPHDTLRQRAEKLITLKIKLGQPRTVDDADMNVSSLLLGTATEVLLKAITLQDDPDWFVKETDQNRHPPKTPSFTDNREQFVDNIAIQEGDLDDEQRERLDDVLQLIQARRNNAVHFNFHEKSTYQTPHQIYKVLEYLLAHFFENADEELIDTLGELKEQTVVETGIDYPNVDLPT